MNKKNLISVVLTVLIASGLIIGGAYAFKNQFAQIGPGETVLNFYEEWVKYDGNPLAEKYYENHPLLNPEFSQKISQIISSFERGGYDPILCAQDKPESITITELKEKEGKANLNLEENFYGQKINLEILLEKKGGKWQIKDIVCPNSEEEEKEKERTSDIKNLLNNYLSQNLSKLSPQKEVLGGKFFPTQIKILNEDRALVEYEDGHNAYIAVVDFFLDQSGNIKINSFDLLGENMPGLEEKINFSEEGNLVKEGESWKLLYEKPGSPALRADLEILSESICLESREEKKCSPQSWQEGQRVIINGKKENKEIKIISIIFKN